MEKLSGKGGNPFYPLGGGSVPLLEHQNSLTSLPLVKREQKIGGVSKI